MTDRPCDNRKPMPGLAALLAMLSAPLGMLYARRIGWVFP